MEIERVCEADARLEFVVKTTRQSRGFDGTLMCPPNQFGWLKRERFWEHIVKCGTVGDEKKGRNKC